MDHLTYLNNITSNSTLPAIPTFPLTHLRFPFTIYDYLGIIILFFMAILANAGGLGGGGTLTPFMLLFLDLNIFECVPIANFLGLTAAVTRFVVNFRQKHPNPKKSVMGKLSIEYEIITLTMPMLYLGTLVGV